MDPSDIGSAADEPADISQLSGGGIVDPATGKKLTLFSLLKLIALQLHFMNTSPAGE